MAVQFPRLGNAAPRVQRGPGPDDGLPLLDPSETVAHEVFGSEIASRDSGRGFGDAQAMWCQGPAPAAGNGCLEATRMPIPPAVGLAWPLLMGQRSSPQRNICMSALANRPATLSS